MGGAAIKKIIGLSIVAAITSAAFWQTNFYGLLPEEKPTLPAEEQVQSTAPAVRVLTESVVSSSDSRIFEAVGTSRSRQSVMIYSPVAEEITSLGFEAGDRVSKGDVLFELENDEEKLAVQLAEVMVRDARRLLDRYEAASEKGAVPESEVDAARADFESAEVQLSQAKLALQDRTILAPFSGFVGIPRVDPGDRITPNTALVALDDRSLLHVDYEIPEQLVSALTERESKTVQATTPAYADRTFTGALTAQESRVNSDRRTLTMRASIDNSEDLLRPGMSFSIRWDIPGKDYPAVPEISLQWGRNGSFVWAIREGKAERVMARVVSRKAGLVLLDGDLKIGELVVMEGVQRMRPGIAVDVLGSEDGELTAAEMAKAL